MHGTINIKSPLRIQINIYVRNSLLFLTYLLKMKYIASTEKSTLVQAMKPRQWIINATPRPLHHRERESVLIIQMAWWAPGPVWTGAENLALSGIGFPYRPALYTPPPGSAWPVTGRNFHSLNLGYENVCILTAVTITFTVLPYVIL